MSDEALPTPAEMKFKLDMQHEIERMVWEAVVALLGDIPGNHPHKDVHTEAAKKFKSRLANDYDFCYELANSHDLRNGLVRTLAYDSSFQNVISSIVTQRVQINYSSNTTTPHF